MSETIENRNYKEEAEALYALLADYWENDPDFLAYGKPRKAVTDVDNNEEVNALRRKYEADVKALRKNFTEEMHALRNQYYDARYEMQEKMNRASVNEAKPHNDSSKGWKLSCKEVMNRIATTPEIKAILSEKKLPTAIRVRLGLPVFIGEYPQDADGEEKPIEWQVISRKGQKFLLLSRYVLDCREFNNGHFGNTWNRCSLRGWLENDFFRQAFTLREQEGICRMPADSADGKEKPGKVFLLSVSELGKYFDHLSDTGCEPTEYAKAQGVNVQAPYGSMGTETAGWWLRSSSDKRKCAAVVTGDGDINCFGEPMKNGKIGVCPAIWIDLSE